MVVINTVLLQQQHLSNCLADNVYIAVSVMERCML